MTTNPTPDNNSVDRTKIVAAAVVVVLLAVVGVGYLYWASGRVEGELADREARAQAAIEAFEQSRPTATADPQATTVPTNVAEPTGPIQPVAQPGEVVVVNRVPGDDYGRLAIRHADGSRTLLDRRCLRVHVAAGNGICLSQDEGLVPTYTTTFYEADDLHQAEIKSYASALPSRARVSADGQLSTVTAFVSGTSYEDISGETFTIVTIDEFEGSGPLRGASQFEVLDDDLRYQTPTAKYWGLSFANNDDFYITGFYGGSPEIMTGSLDDLTVTPTGFKGSCPSLSPDGKTLVFKESRAGSGFDLVAIDLATNKKWILNETRSVDDQVEWLDNDTILYALHPEGGDKPIQPEFDIWMLDIAEGSEPVLFLPNADSPAVIRP